jgi:predicted  nucleic acid-binding Zn-ribbon protein
MPHKCVKCGRLYPESSPLILEGCETCGGRKFLYVGDQSKHKRARGEWPALPSDRRSEKEREPRKEEITIMEPETAKKSREERKPIDPDRVESITIVAPGEYELNITKLAGSDDRVVGMGEEGSYHVDLLSMIKGKRKKKKKGT